MRDPDGDRVRPSAASTDPASEAGLRRVWLRGLHAKAGAGAQGKCPNLEVGMVMKKYSLFQNQGSYQECHEVAQETCYNVPEIVTEEQTV